MARGFLLDTNVVSELRKGARADVGVVQWFDLHADDELWLSALVIGELRRGAELRRLRAERAGAALLRWLDTVNTEYADRVLPVTARIAERWALLNVPNPMPIIDGLLAATAIEHDLVLVTRNVADVEHSGAHVHNPFDVT
jgi:toxin FitB